MHRKVSSEIQSLIDLTLQNPQSEGSFRAVLILLENAPDSSIVVDALAQIDPALVADEAMREQAAELLIGADAPGPSRAVEARATRNGFECRQLGSKANDTAAKAANRHHV